MITRYRLVAAAVAALSLLGLAGIPAAQARHSAVLASMGRLPGPSIFGIDTETLDTSHSNYVRDIPAARSLGARYTHITLGPATATGGFAAADYEVETARKHHMGVVLSLGGISSACSVHTSGPHACPPSNLSVYEAYVRKILLRYRNVVQYYESWAEPNNSSSWTGGPNPAAFARLLEADYATVQSVNGSYHVHLKLLFGSPIGFQIANDPNWEAVIPFTDQVLGDLHGVRAFDAVALHAYRFPVASTGPSSEVCDYVGGVSVKAGFASSSCPSPLWRWMTWSDELTAYDQVFQNHSYGQEPLWLTEFGWTGGSSTSSDVASYSTQATYLKSAYQNLLGLPFVQAAMWFNIRDYQPGLRTGDPSFVYHFGLLRYNFGHKPAAGAFTALAKAHPGR